MFTANINQWYFTLKFDPLIFQNNYLIIFSIKIQSNKIRLCNNYSIICFPYLRKNVQFPKAYKIILNIFHHIILFTHRSVCACILLVGLFYLPIYKIIYTRKNCTKSSFKNIPSHKYTKSTVKKKNIIINK